MSKSTLRDPSQEDSPAASEARQDHLPPPGQRPPDAEMARVLKTAPLRMALDPSGDAIAHWKRSEEHTSELQSLMRITSAVICSQKKQTTYPRLPKYYAS